MQLYPSLITETLSTVRYPGTGKNIVESGMVEDDIRIDGDSVSFTIIFDKPTDPFMRSLVKSCEAAIHTHISPDVKVTVKTASRQPAKPKAAPVLPGVRNIVGVSSGKGGVGKSTVAANLAVALAREGYRVGLLDADIFGPSMPKMFGIEDQQLYLHESEGRQLILPVERYGVKVLSIGFLVDRDKAVLWRGSMASNALKQLITEADWGELDYFLIDMPPGTSDIHLTLVQTLAMTGVVVVSTPQEVALADARKGISMFQDEKVNVPILGLVENMAYFTPAAHPDERYYIFGKEGGVRLAEKLGVRLLAQIPLVASIAESGDAGEPIAMADSITGHAFAHLAHEVTDAVAYRNDNLPPTHKVELKH
ncbi:MAG: Mrp/NBP35 family ATP-binding protein [Duncaniella sp.]|nr:Mrp/NBP35 family ATP-binding protein [Duncaniella sp.]MDE5734734.1 Mrp/NBP35 family ATP-binding protein [Duncaniella sp.]MDE6178006.1 Mrp/NBP35 family ATP-binding protein [Duncaniella sp.]MDE6391562.1 Mrp/NBP35 family ATP-binding protein [Duncaniella sp.]